MVLRYWRFNKKITAKDPTIVEIFIIYTENYNYTIHNPHSAYEGPSYLVWTNLARSFYLFSSIVTYCRLFVMQNITT